MATKKRKKRHKKHAGPPSVSQAIRAVHKAKANLGKALRAARVKKRHKRTRR